MCSIPTAEPASLTPTDGILLDLQHAIDSAHTDAVYAFRQVLAGDPQRALDALERIVATLDAVRA